MIEAIDVVLIHQLLARYGQALDTQDWAALGELFVDDASIDYRSSGGPVERSGRAAIVEWFSGVAHPAAHHVTNFVVADQPDADGRVAVHSKFLAPYTREHHVTKRLYGGDYHDVVVKVDGTWRFAFKQCLPLWNLAVVTDDAAPDGRHTF